MTPVETFAWGSLGGLIAYITVFVMPELRSMIETGVGGMNKVQLIGFILLLVLYPLLGGGMALLIGGATEPKHAVAYGAFWEATFKGIGEGSRIIGSQLKAT